MDMSAAEVKRAAVADGLAQPASPIQSSPPSDPNGSEILVRCLRGFENRRPGRTAGLGHKERFAKPLIMHLRRVHARRSDAQ